MKLFSIQVTQLKITNNPFAKAFRENAADMLVFHCVLTPLLNTASFTQGLGDCTGSLWSSQPWVSSQSWVPPTRSVMGCSPLSSLISQLAPNAFPFWVLSFTCLACMDSSLPACLTCFLPICRTMYAYLSSESVANPVSPSLPSPDDSLPQPAPS